VYVYIEFVDNLANPMQFISPTPPHPQYVLNQCWCCVYIEFVDNLANPMLFTSQAEKRAKAMAGMGIDVKDISDLTTTTTELSKRKQDGGGGGGGGVGVGGGDMRGSGIDSSTPNQSTMSADKNGLF